MLDFTSTNRLNRVLEATASEILAEARHNASAVDAVALARRLGLTVARDTSLNGRARYARLSVGQGRSRGAIFVGQADRPERLQWAVAHELGEIAAHRVASKARLSLADEDFALREQLANELARRILLPLKAFRSAGRECNWDLFDLKRTFPPASHELLARRMLDLPAPVIITVFDHGQLAWRRGNRPNPAPPLMGEERSLAQAVHASQQHQARQTDTLFIRVWPIHEPGWKREIVRTEPRDVCQNACTTE